MLMAGSTGRLFFNFVLSILLLIFWVWIAITTKGINIFGLAFVVLCLFHSIILSTQLIDLSSPVISAGRNGIVLSNKITGHDLIEWNDVKNFSVIDLHWPIYLPFISYLIIRTRRRYLTGVSRIFPMSWFGIYLIPTRFFRGGDKAARQLVKIVDNIREDERHAATHGNPSTNSETSVVWATVRNTQFPVGKDGPSDEARVAAVRDSVMEQAGVHRDLLPEPIHQNILNTGAGRELAALGEKWGRQLILEEKASAPDPKAHLQPKRQPAGFGKRPVLLNGKPLK